LGSAAALAIKFTGSLLGFALFALAARSMGARGPYILFRELLPNLVAPILVYATLIIPSNILFEAALSFLGLGQQPPAPSCWPAPPCCRPAPACRPGACSTPPTWPDSRP